MCQVICVPFSIFVLGLYLHIHSDGFINGCEDEMKLPFLIILMNDKK